MRPGYGDCILERERKERSKRRLLMAGVAVLSVLLIAAAAGAIFFMKKDDVPSEEAMADVAGTEQAVYYTQEEVDAQLEAALQNAKSDGAAEALAEVKELLAGGKTAVEAFREIFTEDLVVASDGQYHFIPIRDDLKKNDYKTENLQVLETGEYQYVENGQVTSYKGIDVSKFQGEIDWQKVAEAGVQFAFIRVGNRGYGTGEIVEDSGFAENIQGAIGAGVKVGVYFYTQAITEEEVLEEAGFVLEKIAPYQVECPVVFDVELVAGDDGRMDALTAEERTRLTRLFCDTIEAAGYQSMIYMNLEMASLRLNLEELEEYDKWFAYYNPDLYFPYDYKVWQYSESGTVSGIQGAVDLNICFEPIW